MNKELKIMKYKKPLSISTFAKKLLQMDNFKLSNNSGVALFIAVLTTSIALVIGTGVLNISLREMKLSSLGGESFSAFYAADTGLECALYWDLDSAGSIFATSSDSIPVDNDNKNCISTDITSIWNYNGPPARTATAATTTFTLQFTADTNDPCANITVAKYQNSSGRIVTKIDSRGLNSCNSANTRRVERGVRITY